MPGTTTHGYPYALPDDALVNWPATSKALADKLNGSTSVDLAGAIIGGWISKVGRITRWGNARHLYLQTSMNPINLAGGLFTIIGALDAQDRPAATIECLGFAYQTGSASSAKPIVCLVASAGAVQIATSVQTSEDLRQFRLAASWIVP